MFLIPVDLFEIIFLSLTESGNNSLHPSHVVMISEFVFPFVVRRANELRTNRMFLLPNDSVN